MSLVLGGVGLVLLLLAFAVYPAVTTGPANPSYPVLQVFTTAPISTIEYAVRQTSAAVATIHIEVDRSSGKPAGHSLLAVATPYGASFTNCRAPACLSKKVGVLSTSLWTKPLTFSWVGGFYTATADFSVKAHNFGAAFNGLTASASIPEIRYEGPGEPQFVVAYRIPSADSYDWSSAPTVLAEGPGVVWDEDLPHGVTAARVATGTNHDRQTSDDRRTFFAGALLGLAGGAILSAIQEALHARDKES